MSKVGAESAFLRLAAQGVEKYLPDCLQFTVDATSGVRLPPPRKYDMIFQIFDAPRRGHSLWREQHEAVQVQADRSFSVLLGCAGSSLPPELWGGRPLWVEIQVIEDKPIEPSEPRIPLARVPFAYHSVHADEADHARDADHADTAKSADSAATAEEALHAETAGYADRAGSADDAGHAKDAVYADTAGFADNAGTAEEAVHAQDADMSKQAIGADEAGHAMTAEDAAHADTAGYADRAGYAGVAGTADEAVHAQVADMAKEAGSAPTAGHADSADRAGYADRAGIANSASTAGYAESAGGAVSAERADDLMCTGCVDEDELSFDPLTQEEFEQAGSPDDLVCTACVDEDELSFDPLTQEEFDQAGSPDDLVCTACVDIDELSFDPLTQQEYEQPELKAALDGFQSSGGCSTEGSGAWGCSATLDEVPEGKIFIIEHVSAWAATEPDCDALVAFDVAPPGSPHVWQFVGLENVSASQPEAAYQYWVANHPTLAYAGESTSPHFECYVGQVGTCYVTASGRLIDAVDARFPFQLSIPVSGNGEFNRAPFWSIPEGYMAVIKHMSARVHVEDPADIVHTIGIQIAEDTGELQLPGPDVIPVPQPGTIIQPLYPPEEPPDGGQLPVPDPFAGAYTYLLTPSGSLLSDWAASEPVLAYVNEGMILLGICGHTLSTLVDCEITVSGYLVELPASP